MALKRVMVLTGGGDCPGLNAVIRGIVKRASQEKDWEVIGCIESFNGVLREPTEIVELDEKSVHGLLVMGGTILGTTNKGGPFEWPVRQPDGSWTTVDRSDEMIRKLQYLGVDAVINIKCFEILCVVGIPCFKSDDVNLVFIFLFIENFIKGLS